MVLIIRNEGINKIITHCHTFHFGATSTYFMTYVLLYVYGVWYVCTKMTIIMGKGNGVKMVLLMFVPIVNL